MKTENKERSNNVQEALSKGRIRVIALLRAALLRFALSSKIIKSKVIKYVESLDDNGNSIIDRVLHGITKRERELPPNLKALSKWLYHFDEEWRRVEEDRNKTQRGDTGIEQNIG